MTIEEINIELEKLREDWVKYPAKREIIKRQARALEIAKEKSGTIRAAQ